MVALVACQRACVWGVGSWVGFLGKGVVEGVVVEVVRLLKVLHLPLVMHDDHRG